MISNTSNKTPIESIKEALEEIKKGHPIIITDDEQRENEGDLLVAAEKITPEMVNFFITHARGLLCVALQEERCDELELEMMVKNNTDPKKTAFTLSIDLKGDGVSTGISVYDRAKTIRALADKTKKAYDFNKPGHIFPLKARKKGVLERKGHTEAAIDLVHLAGLFPAGAIIEILNKDGSMARLPQLKELAKTFKLKIISIENLIHYRNYYG